MPDGRLLGAFALSLLMHVTLVSGRGWSLPVEEAGEPPDRRLEARLVAKASQVPTASQIHPARAQPDRPKPTAKRPRKRRAAAVPVTPQPTEPVVAQSLEPEHDAAAETAELETVPAVAEPEPEPEPDEQQAAASVPPRQDEAEAQRAADTSAAEAELPASAGIRYLVTMGESTNVGQATHAWHRDGNAYSIEAVIETTGLVALFRPIAIRQTSVGGVGPEGLVPKEYRYERDGKITESAHFDWQQNRLSMTSKGRRKEELLNPGSQDLLSQIYQVAVLRAQGKPLAMAITNGKKYRRYAFEAVGEERLQTGLGELRTLHLRAPGKDEQMTEIWIALDHHNLPARIRHRDGRGETYDLVVDRMEVDGVELREKS